MPLIFFLSVQDWHKANRQKLDHLLNEEEFAADEEAEKLGKKNEEAYLFSLKMKRKGKKFGRKKESCLTQLAFCLLYRQS